MRESFVKRGLARMLPGLNEPAMAEVTE
jgi:hypothetical protein